MVSVLIPLIGMVEMNESALKVVGLIVGKTLLIKKEGFDLQTWEILCIKKTKGRYRSINDLVRVEFLGMPRLKPPVKRYSDEGENIAAIKF